MQWRIKSVTRVYEKSAALEGFRFHGHVDVGVDITHAELLARGGRYARLARPIDPLIAGDVPQREVAAV